MEWVFPEASSSIPEWELPQSSHSSPSEHPDDDEPSQSEPVAEESGECYTEVEELTCQEGDASVYLASVGVGEPVST